MADEAPRLPVEREVLRDSEPREARDVELEVLLHVPAHRDLEREIEASLLVRDDPAHSLVVVGVEHGDEVRREHRLAGVVDGELGREVDAPLRALEELLERLERAALRAEMRVALGRAGARDLRGERRAHLGALLVRHSLPDVLGRGARIERVDAITGGRGGAPFARSL
jgi:hypothetical protein